LILFRVIPRIPWLNELSLISTPRSGGNHVRILTKLIITAGLLATVMMPKARADDDDPKVRKSVVKITASIRSADYFRPWTKNSPQEVTGSGVVITGNRILTNSHVVNAASQIFVQPDKSSDKVQAKVLSIAPAIDLAVLKLEDPAFFEAHPPLQERLQLPKIQQTVFAYGYPEGGMDLSITRGIVSRLEFAEYYLSTDGLRIQIDAAINPGNSGGPAIVDGQMIGLVFSKLQQADNIGYIIPMEEIELFLKDVEDGKYDGKPILIDEIQNLENDALRRKLKLEKKTTGVLLRKPAAHDGPYPLRAGDIITKIGDHPIDNAGMVREGDHHLKFQYQVQRLSRDNKVSMTIVRDGKEQTVDVPVGPDQNRWLFPYLVGNAPSYFIYGPLVFTEATSNYVRAFTSGDGPDTMLGYASQGNLMMSRYGDRPAFPDERVVLLAHPMFVHKIGTGYRGPYGDSVAEVNGVSIRNLKHLVETLRDVTDEFVEFRFRGRYSEAIVFNRKEALDATEEILSDNGIRDQCSSDVAPIWNHGKTKKP
jgi:S1-C subfamily serine protease